jgi:hypothetical protein
MIAVLAPPLISCKVLKIMILSGDFAMSASLETPIKAVATIAMWPIPPYFMQSLQSNQLKREPRDVCALLKSRLKRNARRFAGRMPYFFYYIGGVKRGLFSAWKWGRCKLSVPTAIAF